MSVVDEVNEFGVNPIQRKKLSDFVCEKLLKYFEIKQLKPGDFIPSEKDIMSMFQVGRAVARESQQTLKHMGVIEIKHGDCPKIVEPSINNIADKTAQSMSYLVKFSENSIKSLQDARKFIEVGFVRFAAKNSNKNKTKELRTVLVNHKKILQEYEFDSTKVKDLIKIDILFHKKIAAISENQIIEAFTNSFFSWISVSRLNIDFEYDVEVKTYEAHENILNAIENNDPDLAEKYMTEHLKVSELLSLSDHFIK